MVNILKSAENALETLKEIPFSNSFRVRGLPKSSPHYCPINVQWVTKKIVLFKKWRWEAWWTTIQPSVLNCRQKNGECPKSVISSDCNEKYGNVTKYLLN